MIYISFFLSGSEDGIARVWDIERRRSTQSLTHNAAAEVLRVAKFEAGSKLFCCTSGSDGISKLWCRDIGSSQGLACTLEFSHGDSQIYASEFVNNGVGLLTAAENDIYIWSLEGGSSQLPRRVTFDTYSCQTDALLGDNLSGSSVNLSFGGPRNPDNKVFVFDAKSSPADCVTVAAGLSDGIVPSLQVITTYVCCTLIRHGAAGGSALARHQQVSFPLRKLHRCAYFFCILLLSNCASTVTLYFHQSEQTNRRTSQLHMLRRSVLYFELHH